MALQATESAPSGHFTVVFWPNQRSERRSKHFSGSFRETVWKIRIGLDLGCSEWPKQGGDVPSHPLEPLSTGNEEPSSYFPDSFRRCVPGNSHVRVLRVS